MASDRSPARPARAGSRSGSARQHRGARDRCPPWSAPRTSASPSRAALRARARSPATSPSPRQSQSRSSERRTSGFDLVPIPVASFNSDTGFGVGLVVLAYFYAKDYRPYQHGLTAQFFATTTGFQGHYITWDAPHLLGPVRVEARVEFHKDPYAPYYGPGNHTFPGQFLNGPDKFFGYQSTWTSDWVRFRIKPLGDAAPLTLYAGYQYRYFWITPYPGSNLDMERPNGVNGGRNGAAVAGILFDTRDDEQNTHWGSWCRRPDGWRGPGPPVSSPIKG